MNVQEMITYVWEALGERSDLNIYDSGTTNFNIALDGSVKLLSWLNRSYLRLLGYKLPNGALLRFPVLEDNINFQITLRTGTADAGGTATITLPAGFQTVDDYYNNWIIKITSGTGSGQKRMIMDYVGSTLVATVDEDWGTEPDATSVFGLFKNFIDIVSSTDPKAPDGLVLDPVDSVLTVVSVVDIKDRNPVPPGDRIDKFANNMFTIARPDIYIKYGNKLVFNSAPDDNRWYRFEYMKIPEALVSATDEPLIPSIWHEFLVMFSIWLGLKQKQEVDQAWSVRRDLENFVITTKQAIEMSFEREEGRAVVDFGY